MSQKLLIIVLVALAVIFLITLGISGCQRSRTPSPDRAGFVGALKGLQGNRFLVIGDKARTTCAPVNGDPETWRVNGMCDIILEKRAFFRKSTRVAFRRCIDPPACRIPIAFPSFEVMVNPRNERPRTDQVAGKRCYGTAIGPAGGTITLTGNAIIALQRQGCPPE